MDQRLAELARRAAEITEGVPAEVRGALTAEVFRALFSGDAARGTSSTPPAVRETGAHATEEPHRALPPTMGEYLAELGAVSHPIRLTAVAAFRLRQSGVDACTSDDLLGAYAESRLPKPQNLSLNVGRAMKRGWLVSTSREGRRAWRVTQRGLEMLGQLGRDRDE